MRAHSISDLARVVDHHLKKIGEVTPGVSALSRLLEVVYFTSLKTEEATPLQLRIALVDPEHPDPGKPPRPRPQRWKITNLATRVPLTVPNLVKLSKAADPWSSCLAVYHDHETKFYVWGLVDQTVHFNTMLVRESEHGYAPPGSFQVVSTGTADLTVYQEHGFVARLAQDTLLRKQSDVFWSGPVSDRLDKGITPHLDSVSRRLRPQLQNGLGEWEPLLADTWISTLCRILISIQRYRHGGALLITQSPSELDIKYRIKYARLPKALVNLGVKTIEQDLVQGQIHSEYLDQDDDFVPAELHLDEVVTGYDIVDYRDEITGAVRFIASLSCVDGLVLAAPNLSIRGFGVEIRTRREVESLFLSSEPKAREKELRQADPNHYGTRHRSMMRYCFAHPASLGFVISQDGEIRAMTRVRKRLVMWENLKVLDSLEVNAHTRRNSSAQERTEPKASPKDPD